jgi:hypothetical protein
MGEAVVRIAVLAGLYLILAGQVSTDEVVSGAICAGSASAISLLVRHRAERRFQFSGCGGLRVLTKALAALPAETWRVASRLARPAIPPGALRRRPSPAAEPGPRAAASRAITILSASLAPNSYVVAELAGRPQLLLHVLVDAEHRQGDQR